MKGHAGSLAGVLVLAVVAALAAVLLPRGAAALIAATAILLAVTLRSRVSALRAPSPPVNAAPAVAVAPLLPLLAPLREGVVLLDGALTVLEANPAAAAILGRRPGEMRGRSLMRATGDHNLLRVAREATGDPDEFVAHDEHVLRAAACRVAAGEVRTVLAIEDVTALRQAERSRSELVANVSHEIRTPLAAARALAETLAEGVDEEALRERFQRQLSEEIDRLGGMVERLLRLARLESGSERLVRVAVPSGELLTTAALRIAPLAERLGCRVVVGPGEALTPVLADRERVLEVLSNLLDNALRYSPPGGEVSISAQRDAQDVRFEVRDQGPGILPGERERVFERFYTGDPARTGGASGLGLAIARHIVDRLGGRIWVGENERGARLCFTLPVAGGPPELTAAAADAPASGS